MEQVEWSEDDSNAILVIQNGTTKLVNVRNQDVTKILNMVPRFGS